jgi:hypothetical protein
MEETESLVHEEAKTRYKGKAILEIGHGGP